MADPGGYFAPGGSLPADIDGEGDEVEEFMPFVWIPGGTGRFTLEESDCVAVAEGAILYLRSAGQST